MALPLLATKTYLPMPHGGCVHRTRLFDRLDGSLNSGQRLILLSAPAGSGKSTLIGDWAAQRRSRQAPLPLAWLSLDPQDNDPARFGAYLAAALQSVNPGFLADLQADLLSPQPPALTSLLPELLNRIAGLPGRTLLALDDYHLIDQPAIHESLAYLVEHAPPGFAILLLTRSDPPLPLSRWRVRGYLVELRSADLNFQSQEAAAFLNGSMGLRLDPQDIDRLQRRTEGWAAGLQLAALSMQGRPDPQGFISRFSASHQYILDYLTSEVLSLQPAVIQDFLVQTSILDRLTASLCREVTGNQDSAAILERLQRENLFVISLDDERNWFRYHHLFAELLRLRLASMGPDKVASLHLAAGSWHDRQGMVDEALRHALEAGENEYAADIVNRNWRKATDEGRLKVARGWLRALPAEVVENHPLLSMATAWTLWLTGETVAAEPYLAAAGRSFRTWEAAGKIPQGNYEFDTLPCQMAACQALIAVRKGELQQAADYARQAIVLSLEQESLALGLAYTALAMALRELGEIEEAIDAYRHAIPAVAKTGNELTVAGSIYQLGRLLRVQGRLEEAQALYQEALDQAGEQARPTAYGIVQIGLAELAYEYGNLGRAETLWGQGIEYAQRSGYPELIKSGSYLKAKLLRARGESAAALAYLEDAISSMRGKVPPGLLVELQSLQACLQVENEQAPAAAGWAETVPDKIERTPGLAAGVQLFNLARVYLALGQPGRALSMLEALSAAALQSGSAGRQIEASLLAALARSALGDPQGAQSSLLESLALAEPRGYMRLFVDEGRPLYGLLEQIRPGALPNSVSAYVQKLLAAFAGLPPAKAAPTSPPGSGLVEPLSRREIEVLRLLAQGQSNPEIAARLVISLATVKTHIIHIYGKLGVQNRVEAVNRAKELELV